MFGQLVGTLRTKRSRALMHAPTSVGFAEQGEAQHGQGSRSSRSDGMVLAVNSSGT